MEKNETDDQAYDHGATWDHDTRFDPEPALEEEPS